MKTPQEALNPKSKSFSLLKKENGEKGDLLVTAFLTYAVTDLIKSFNVGKTMNEMQAVFTVNGIKADYYFLRPEELKYCFDNAKKGRYGTTYDRIDAQVIFEWIEKYLLERNQVCYDRNIEKQKLDTKGLNEQTKLVKKVISDSRFKKPEEPEIKYEIKERELTEAEKIVQDIFKEFDKLYETKSIKSNIRTIYHKGKNLTQSEYLELRLEEIYVEKTKNNKDVC